MHEVNEFPLLQNHRRRTRPWLIGALLGLALLVGMFVVVLTRVWSQPAVPNTAPSAAAPLPETRHPVIIRQPAGPPSIRTGTFDEKGQPITVACASCHATRPPNALAKLGTPLTAFHQGLTGRHAELSCISCHNPAEGYGSLRLADGKSVPHSDVMTLCAQCHGPQFRDYQHGAHGGMSGYWDLTRGGRFRNNCIDCHEPHAPKNPTVAPAMGPNDRFLRGAGHE